ncbi:MAG: M48 family metalloprotease [Hydrogenophaga sp.]|jgi:predicted Zn-dependent protease|nr:M48 family metalloprotease [Hydrogenophaga sp.]
MYGMPRFIEPVLLLAALAIPLPAASQVACHDDPLRINEQREIDEAQIAAMLSAPPQVSVPAHIRSMLDDLVRVSPRLHGAPPVQLVAIHDRELNAFAADHGVIILTTALWDPRHGLSDDELAAVLAHELAHVEARDGLAEACDMQLRVGDASTGIAQVRARLATLNPASALGRNAVELLHEQELLADARGITLLKLAGRNPQAMPSVLAKLHAPGPPGASVMTAPTHPELGERLARAEALAH